MDEGLKQLLAVVLVVIVAVALIVWLSDDAGFVKSITDKIASAIAEIDW